jgi:hypothetical protein
MTFLEHFARPIAYVVLFVATCDIADFRNRENRPGQAKRAIRPLSVGCAVVAVVFLFSNCAPAPVRNYKHGPRCEADGYHRHIDSTKAGK